MSEIYPGELFRGCISEVLNSKCQQCGFSSKGASSLKRHMILAHTGEESLSCNICGNKFKTIKTLGIHMTLHIGGESFQCSDCDHKSARKSSLKIHMFIHMVTSLIAVVFVSINSEPPLIWWHILEHIQKRGHIPVNSVIMHLPHLVIWRNT